MNSSNTAAPKTSPFSLTKVQRSYIQVCILSFFVGVFLFGLFYGFGTLNPVCDSWIIQGYDETDIIQHYAGWCAFRSSPWNFPLGVAATMGYGTVISFTDSIPCVAIVAKALLGLIGYSGTFQYFGLYTLTCYIMQCLAIGLIVRRKSQNPLFLTLSMVLVCFMPSFLDRAFRHTALGSQWLVLLAIYTYFRAKDNGFSSYPKSFYLLAVLAITIHPYFIPLVMIFAFITTFYGCFKSQRSFYFLGMFLGNLLSCAVAGYCIGVIGWGIQSSRWGFGYFSMNLNAILNPISSGGYTWSALLSPLPQIYGNYDGFNYLGMGLLTFALWAVLGLAKQHRLGILVRQNWFYLLSMVFMTAFALSNVVTFNDQELFVFPLPQLILDLCGIFRASSRMFYAVSYSLLVFCLYTLLEALKSSPAYFTKPGSFLRANASLILLAFFVFLQVFDLHHVVLEKHSAMDQRMDTFTSLDDTYLAERLTGYEYFTSDTSSRQASLIALKNGLTTLYSVANSGKYSQAEQNALKCWEALENGQAPVNVAFETNDPDKAAYLYNAQPNLEVYESQGSYFLFPPTS